jgi:hypothetical protein
MYTYVLTNNNLNNTNINDNDISDNYFGVCS